jgi:extracellular elastinolytic metalloproteinase
MGREIDTRNFAVNRAEKNRPILEAAVESVSKELPGNESVKLSGVNMFTGTPGNLKSENSPTATGSLIERALEHVNFTARAFGFAPGEPAEFVPDPKVQETSSGSAAVNLHQYYRGIPVFQMVRTVRFSPNKEITDTVGDNSSLPAGIDILPQMDVRSAVLTAARYVASPKEDETESRDGWGQSLRPTKLDVSDFNPEILATFPMPSRPTVLNKGPFETEIPANLVIFDQGEKPRLGWYMAFTFPQHVEGYVVIVSCDDAPGEILFCKQTVQHVKAKGNVFEESPGRTPRSLTSFPRSIEDYHAKNNANLPADFPWDWVTADKTEGINVDAVLDDEGSSLNGSLEGAVLIFNPQNDSGNDQEVLNIFYFCNVMHDFFYMLGFNELSGNFQTDNFMRGGSKGDPVGSHAYNRTVRGTAYMSTPPDGQSPTMVMGLVRLQPKDRSTALDADVVFHEFTHGVTNRMVGGPMNNRALDADQSGSMGEGWSDYFALTFQNFGKPNERVVTGDWAVARPSGIRMHPYDENYPGKFGDIGPNDPYNEVHNAGEIWCATLIHMNRLIGRALGSKEKGHQLGWQLVIDALKLTPSNPNFIQARNAILKALDDMRTAGKLNDNDHKEVKKGTWTAFAKFGMGVNASSAGNGFGGVHADFSLPNNI